MTGSTNDLDLTVIVPVHNAQKTLPDQLTALTGQQWSGAWEVLIVDNASDDATPELIAGFVNQRPDLFRSVQAPMRRNLAYARNTGVAASSGRAVAFCDADDVVAPGWVAAIGDALAVHRLVGSRLEYRLLNDVRLAEASSLQTNSLNTFLGRRVVAGCGMGCQRDTWVAAGGMCEGMIAEDTEFSLRLSTRFAIEPTFVGKAKYHYRLRDRYYAEFRRSARQGKGEVQLYKLWGGPVHRRRLRSSLLAQVAGLRLLVGGRSRADRMLACRRIAAQLGRIEGSVLYRVLYP